MPPIQVVSEFQPTGDQPQAIAKLADGIRQGMKHQVLLGVTGSGKSLGYNDPVYIVEQRDGKLRRRITPIGPLVDAALEQGASEIADDARILNVTTGDTTYFAQSFNPQSGEVSLQPISALTRHAAPQTMFRVCTACGREATLTGDHNLWVLRAGRLQLIETQDARSTDYAPIPERLPDAGSLPAIDLVTVFSTSSRNLYVHASDALSAHVAEQGVEQVSRVLEADGISAYNKVYAARHQLKGQGIRVATFAKLLDNTHGLGNHWDASQAHIAARDPNSSLPAALPVTADLMRLIGYYIAEGNTQRGFVILANRAEGVRRDIEDALCQLHQPFFVRSSSDYQVSSTVLAVLLGEQCGHTARHKRLPSFWPDLSQPMLAHLLRAYFDGDGTVERGRCVSATTASAQLASDLLYALLRFGIWARVRRVWKVASNSAHAGDWYYTIAIYGQENLHRFQEAIGFSLSYKRERLAALVHGRANSNVDVTPIDGADLRRLRTELGLSMAEVGRRSGLSRPTVHMIEENKRRPQRLSLLSILEVLKQSADDLELPESWWELWRTLHSLCHLHWTPIASVEPVTYEYPYVYDFTVPGTETFLAGAGGFFVHNTYSMAKVIEQVQKPTLIMAHNKTLAAQLYAEMREFLPNNSVEYFVSYYDYYQPEAYIPRTDTYIEKDAQINEEIDRLRLAATSALFSRRDVVIVASVSCIYGLGSPQDYGRVVLNLRVGEMVRRNQILRHLVEIYYDRNDNILQRGRFRVRGDVLEVQPADRETAYRVSLWGDEIERISEIDTLTGELIADHQQVDIFPAKHFVTPQDRLEEAIEDIRKEMEEQVGLFQTQGKLLEAQRIQQRTNYDIEMLREVGYCNGIENYSRPLAGRPAGSTPWTLLDYFPSDWLLIIDESHMTVPQVRGMYNGDRARKEVLVGYGFRLPSALDNRPLMFSEFEDHLNQAVYVSATPGPYEKEHAEQVVEQVIRPTGLIDPVVEVRPTKGQIDDLLREIKLRTAHGQRVLVTTLTKRMAEDLTEYLAELTIKVHYLHSEIHTIERVEILRDLRLGVYDVVVGINLLREGLDLPEVSLVAVLDADKEGFLRSGSALIQTIGRAARHVEGKAILYADVMTDSMRFAIDETNRRRTIQEAYNREHGIEPQSIVKGIRDLTDRVRVMAESKTSYRVEAGGDASQQVVLTADPEQLTPEDLNKLIKSIEQEMKTAAKALEFERAAALRDQLVELRRIEVERKVAA